MNFLSRSAKILTFLLLGLFFSQVLAQDACSANNLSSSSESANGTYVIGYAGVYSYQLWYDHGQSGSAKFYNDGAMSCSFSGVGDYLCRMGLQFNSDKTYDKLGGDIIAEFRLDKQNIQGVNYSYVGVYGWMEHVPGAPSQLVEYYVVDNTLANDMPGSWVGNEYFGEFKIDDGNYKVYRNTRSGPAIGGNDSKQFHQYFSIRTSPRTCGKINVSAHIKKWKELGMPDGDLYEAKVLGEAGCNGNGHRHVAPLSYLTLFTSDKARMQFWNRLEECTHGTGDSLHLHGQRHEDVVGQIILCRLRVLHVL